MRQALNQSQEAHRMLDDNRNWHFQQTHCFSMTVGHEDTTMWVVLWCMSVANTPRKCLNPSWRIVSLVHPTFPSKTKHAFTPLKIWACTGTSCSADCFLFGIVFTKIYCCSSPLKKPVLLAPSQRQQLQSLFKNRCFKILQQLLRPQTWQWTSNQSLISTSYGATGKHRAILPAMW